jgi:hypothetical protein
LWYGCGEFFLEEAAGELREADSKRGSSLLGVGVHMIRKCDYSPHE